MANNNDSEKLYSQNDISKDLDDIFSNEPEISQNDDLKQSTHKPISTVVGRAFDVMDQQLLNSLEIKKESNLNSDQDNSKNPPKAPNKSGNTGKNSKSSILNTLKKTVIGRVKSNKEVEIIEQNLKKVEEAVKPNDKNSKKLYAREEAEDDIFTDEGIIEDDEISSLKEVLDHNIQTFLYVFDKYTLKIKNIFSKILLKVGIKSLGSVNKVLTKNIKEDEKAQIKNNRNPVKEEIKEVVYEKGSFDNMVSLNIIFTDNYDVNFYKTNTLKMSKMEEELVMSMAIEAIKECAQLTEGQPPIKEGMYAGKLLATVMDEVKPEIINLYLGYVKTKPKKYIGKKWKISETFATWLMLGTPLIIQE